MIIDPLYHELLFRASANIAAAKIGLQHGNVATARANAQLSLDTLDYFLTRLNAAAAHDAGDLGAIPVAPTEASLPIETNLQQISK